MESLIAREVDHMLSRRHMLGLPGPLLLVLGRKLCGGEPVTRRLDARLAHEFPNSTLRAISPDGTKLCLEDWSKPKYPLKVVEVGTWLTLMTDRFQCRVLEVAFFADSQSLLLQFPPEKGKSARGQTLWQLSTGARIETMRNMPGISEGNERDYAIAERLLLVARHGIESHRIEYLSKVSFPGYEELVRAVIPAKDGASVASWRLWLSGDGTILAYYSDNELVCRRVDDLKVLWKRPIAQDFRVGQLAISSDGGRIAASVVGREGREGGQSSSYISVYDGKNGTDVARLPLGEVEGMAVSPDGSLIALSGRQGGRNGEVSSTVHIRDISSGVELLSVVHDRITRGRHQWLKAGCVATFSSTSEYLITSGMTTKLWRLGSSDGQRHE